MAAFIVSPGAAFWETLVSLEGMGPVVGQAAGVDSLGRIIVYVARVPESWSKP